MRVELVDFTGNVSSAPDIYAMRILVMTKNTRLEMNDEARKKLPWNRTELLKEIEYMANTIPSSWEFIDYTFAIEEVSIACARQIMRSRVASFAQKSLRVVDISDGFGYRVPPNLSEEQRECFTDAMFTIKEDYADLIRNGAKPEDARGVLPLNMHTNFMMKINLRNFIDLVHKRSTPRVQDEYREVLELMKSVVLQAHPFVSIFLERTFDKAADELSLEINALDIGSHGSITAEKREKRMRMQKLLDQMRSKS